MMIEFKVNPLAAAAAAEIKRLQDSGMLDTLRPLLESAESLRPMFASMERLNIGPALADLKDNGMLDAVRASVEDMERLGIGPALANLEDSGIMFNIVSGLETVDLERVAETDRIMQQAQEQQRQVDQGSATLLQEGRV